MTDHQTSMRTLRLKVFAARKTCVWLEHLVCQTANTLTKLCAHMEALPKGTIPDVVHEALKAELRAAETEAWRVYSAWPAGRIRQIATLMGWEP